MSRRDPPTGVSGIVVAAALAVGGAFLLPAARAGDESLPAAVACPPEAAAARDGSATPAEPR